MTGIELPEPERRKTGADHGDRDRQITTLIEIIAGLTKQINRVEGRLNRLAKTVHDTASATDDHDEDDPAEPAPWVWFSPPAATEDDPDTANDPRETVANFIAWYNLTYTGPPGGRSTRIPDCWHQHPGLAAELATLAYTWRAANIGPDATARDAQYWHHQWRPGLLDRLTRDWIHPDCLDGQHRPGGGEPRPDRHTLAEHHTVATSQPSEEARRASGR